MTNRKTTKRALLSSILALVLCFAMLLGTTFAWFTDIATTNVSTIQAGTLDVQLLDAQGNSLEGQTLTWQKAADGAQQEILWEPGCTYNLQPITIKNGGNLALKYKIVITGIQGDAELNNAIEWTLTNGEAVSAAAEGEANEPSTATPLETEYHLTAGQSHTLTISGHMKEAAGNEYQGKTIDNIAITVYATQDTVEFDSIDNFYDANADYGEPWDGTPPTAEDNPMNGETDEDGNYHISTAAQLVALMNATQTANSPYIGETIVLDNSINLGGQTVKGFGSDYANIAFNFDGRGYTISNFKIDRSESDYYAGLFNYLYGANVKDLTVANATIIGNKQVGAVVGALSDNSTIDNCKAINCTVTGQKKVGGVVGYAVNSTATNCFAKDCTVICANSEETESSEVVGFINTGCTTSNLTHENVTLLRGVSGATVVAPGVTYADNTYFISSVAGLNWFNDQCNKQGKSFNGQTIKLMSDIDMKTANWLPAGQNDAAMYDGIDASYNTVQFLGDFDGNGKTISNINIKGLSDTQVEALNAAQQQVYSVGFIGYTSGATIKNLTIKNATVTGSHYVAAIVGMTDAGGSVENCKVVDSTITCKHLTDDQCGDKAGGIVGILSSEVTTLKNCSVSNTTIKACRDAGAIVGAARVAMVTGCDNITDVTVSALANSDCCSDTNHGNNISSSAVGRDLT